MVQVSKTNQTSRDSQKSISCADWLTLGSCAVGDALRGCGHPFQCMEADIHAIAPGMRLAGPAFTVRTYPGATWALEQAMDLAAPGDVLVVDAGGRPDTIIMGELMSMRAQKRGLAGAIVDGAVRDVDDIADMGFPVFARYVCPRCGTMDQIGQWQVPIACGRVVVQPGDIVIADASGISVVPAVDEQLVYHAALQVKTKEEAIARHLQAGLDLPTAVQRAKDEIG